MQTVNARKDGKVGMIQIDMPMPESCYECPLNYDFSWCNGMTKEEWEIHEDDWNKQVCECKHRPEYCPLKEQPEMVRCKDCHFYWGNGWCNRSGIHLEVNDDWFCADGIMERLSE